MSSTWESLRFLKIQRREYISYFRDWSAPLPLCLTSAPLLEFWISSLPFSEISCLSHHLSLLYLQPSLSPSSCPISCKHSQVPTIFKKILPQSYETFQLPSDLSLSKLIGSITCIYNLYYFNAQRSSYTLLCNKPPANLGLKTIIILLLQWMGGWEIWARLTGQFFCPTWHLLEPLSGIQLVARLIWWSQDGSGFLYAWRLGGDFWNPGCSWTSLSLSMSSHNFSMWSL